MTENNTPAREHSVQRMITDNTDPRRVLPGRKLVSINGEKVGPWGIEDATWTNIGGGDSTWKAVDLTVWIGEGLRQAMVGVQIAPFSSFETED